MLVLAVLCGVDDMYFHNLTLILPQLQQTSTSEYIIIATIVSGFFLLYREKLKSDKEEYKMRVMAYSRLMGIKKVISQLYLSYYDNYLKLMEYHCLSWLVAIEKLEYDEKNERCKGGVKSVTERDKEFNEAHEKSLEFRGVQKNEEKSDNLLCQLNRTRERFSITIGTVRIIFSEMEKLEDLIEQILILEKDLENFSNDANRNFVYFNKRLDAERVKISSNKERQRFVYQRNKEINVLYNMYKKDIVDKTNNFESKIDKLLNYLKAGIKRKHWWQLR